MDEKVLKQRLAACDYWKYSERGIHNNKKIHPSNFKIDIPLTMNPFSHQYKTFWKEQKRRCIEGYWYDGKWMPGNLYFYINFCKMLLNLPGSKGKTLGSPFLRDVEWEKAYVYVEARGFSGFELDDTITCLHIVNELNILKKESEEAYKERLELAIIPKSAYKKDGSLKTFVHPRDYLRRIHTSNYGKPKFENNASNVVDIQARRQGKSWGAAGSMITYNFLFDGATDYDIYLETLKTGNIPSSETLVGAIDSKYSGDLLNKTKLIIENLKGSMTFNGVERPSPFAKQTRGSLAPGKFLEAAYEQKLQGGWVTKGSRSKIHHRTFADNPLAGNGTGPNLIVLEEVGFFSNVVDTFSALTDATKDGLNKFGTIYATGTGGDMGKGVSEGVMDMFFNPEKYDALCFEDIWEGNGNIGFFIPYQFKFDEYRDEYGDIDINKASKVIEAKREKLLKSKDRYKYLAEQQNNPECPTEAFLIPDSNIFPTAELKEQRNFVMSKSKTDGFIEGQNGELVFDPENNNNVKWVPDLKNKLQPCKWNMNKNDDTTGCITIWEHPQKNHDGEIPWGLYIAGCLTPGEKVITAKGLKNVEDVTLDDKLINKDGIEVSINTLLRYNKVNEPTYKLHMYNMLRPTNYTQEHPIYAADNIEDEFSFKRVREIKKDMWTKVPNYYKLNEKEIDITIWNKYKIKNSPKIENPLNKEDFWWFIGHWLGDGFCYNRNRDYTITNTFGNNEDEYLNKYKNIVKKIFNRSPSHKKSNGIKSHVFNSKQLFIFLEDNFGKYAHGKYISDWIKYIPAKYKLQIILGYLDSDGSVFIDNGSLKASFKSVNKQLLHDIQDILFSLGIVSRLDVSQKSGKQLIYNKLYDRKESYNLFIGKNYLNKFANYFSNDCNSRKLRMAKDIVFTQTHKASRNVKLSKDDNFIFLKIKDIEKDLYTGTVYNFDCDTHSFLCPYCTTHNCDPYDQDQSTTASLGSTFIYKTFGGIDQTSHRIVAEYTARPDTAKEHHNNVIKLLMYYNAELLYENERNSILTEAKKLNKTHLFAKQPTILKAYDNTKVQRDYGTHMTAAIKSEMIFLLKDWLMEENASGLLNLNHIYSIPLLDELINYNDTGNFDRVIALLLTITLKNQRHKIKVEMHKRKIIDPFFSNLDTYFK